MEDEEIQSYASPGSEPHSPPSGRITVTVAAAPPPSLGAPAVAKYASPVMPSNQSSLTLALPIQGSSRPVGGSGGGGGGREDCWSEGATSVLINAWGERYTELSRGNLKQKHWKEVADIVSSREDYTKTPKTDIQCKNRIDTVKKKYKIEKAKVVSGCGPSRWPFFERLDRFLSPSSAASAAKIASPATAVAAAVGSNSQRGVPVGIPFGVRPLPLPALPHYSPHHHLHMPPHLQSQPPPPPPPSQQHFRPNNISPLPMFNKFNNSVNNNANNNANNVNNNNKQLRRGPPPPLPLDSESDPEEGWSQDSGDSLPPLERGKRPKVELNSLGGEVNKGKGKGKRKREKAMGVWGNSVRELTRAILKFGEAYEAAESAKLQQIVEMEKQRMKFAKELELQRMKFLMKTQLELSQLNDDGSNNSDTRAGGSSGRAGGGGGGGGNHHNHHDNHLSHAISDASD